MPSRLYDLRPLHSRLTDGPWNLRAARDAMTWRSKYRALRGHTPVSASRALLAFQSCDHEVVHGHPSTDCLPQMVHDCCELRMYQTLLKYPQGNV